METKNKYARSGRQWAMLLLCGALTSTLLGGALADNAVKAVTGAKSEFTDDPKIGKDPFFPNSERRKPKNEPSGTVEVGVLNVKMRLQGISGNAEKRLAIVNNRTFAVGEEAEIKLDGKPVKVRCTDIRERSVIMTINGQQQELTLGARF